VFAPRYAANVLAYNQSGTAIDGVHKYIPALSDGSDDTEGLGITNPAKNYVHNNTESSLVINSVTNTYGNLLTNAAYNASTDTNGFITEIYIEN
jgi:hypothetical protein